MSENTGDVRAHGRRRCVLRADGYEPFEHVSTGDSDRGAAEFCVQVWLLGHPERRAATNIKVTIEDFEPSESGASGEVGQ